MDTQDTGITLSVCLPIKQGANGPGPAALHNPSRKFQKQVPQLWKIMNFDRQNALLNGASIEAII
jgi:hypothetical protein